MGALGASQIGSKYTGHVKDVETNLVYTKVRYYDSVTDYFLNKDPIESIGADAFSFNRYAYVNNIK